MRSKRARWPRLAAVTLAVALSGAPALAAPEPAAPAAVEPAAAEEAPGLEASSVVEEDGAPASPPQEEVPAIAPPPAPEDGSIAQQVSKAIIGLAWWSGVILSLLVGLLMGVVLVLRLRLILRRRHETHFMDQWRPLLMAVMLGEKPRTRPIITSRDWPAMLAFWNHLLSAVRGEARDNLIRAGKQLGLEDQAMRMLKSPSRRRQLFGMLTLGNMRASAAWDSLLSLVGHEDPIVSQTAMRALLAIDVHAGLPLLVHQLAYRDGWSPVAVANMLYEAGFDNVAGVLSETACRLPSHTAGRLVRFLVLMRSPKASPALRHLLSTTDNPQLISLCLQASQDPGDLELIRRFLQHPEWFVRVQAVNALGRLGGHDDLQPLLRCLSDSQWWVRYRAAKSLANLPFITMADLANIGTDHPDRFARDIVLQVLAEAVGT